MRLTTNRITITTTRKWMRENVWLLCGYSLMANKRPAGGPSILKYNPSIKILVTLSLPLFSTKL
ncbi:unnamed protein product [Meloidogyne enterolobii]|uniref:Uncharacterized protein n=1 Tax=Meloidogyne enterolobii TaxID=390850 RepID=A0ACB1AFV4_MELEN